MYVVGQSALFSVTWRVCTMEHGSRCLGVGLSGVPVSLARFQPAHLWGHYRLTALDARGICFGTCRYRGTSSWQRACDRQHNELGSIPVAGYLRGVRARSRSIVHQPILVVRSFVKSLNE